MPAPFSIISPARYAAYRHCDSGTHGNVIYMFDGGSIAAKNEQNLSEDSPHFEFSGEKREMWLARVGEHHNTPEYSSFGADANTVMCLPVDMNFFAKQMGGRL